MLLRRAALTCRLCRPRSLQCAAMLQQQHEVGALPRCDGERMLGIPRDATPPSEVWRQQRPIDETVHETSGPDKAAP